MLALLFAVLSSDLDAVLDDPALAGSVVAAHVREIGGEVLYERNAALRVVPASNQKLLTCAYVLARLGPDFRPQTKIWKESKRLVVQANGDPGLTYSDLLEARQKLRLSKPLPVYVWQAYAPGIPPSWEADDLPNKYAAPVTAFTVDRGSFELWAVSGKAVLLPRNYGVKVERLAGTSRRVLYNPVERVVRVVGPLPSGRERLDTLALPYSDRAAASVLAGDFATAKAVPASTPTLTLTGRPLSSLVKECLEKSDNQFAEHFLLMAAAKEGGLGLDPYDTAAQRLSKFLVDEVGFSEGDARPVDGSGLSRHNLVTTRGLTRLLDWCSRQPWFGLFADSLAAPGEGTLIHRLENVPFLGKTGSLNSVNSLSGYLEVEDGRTLAVSLVFNHFLCPADKARMLMDEFLRKIHLQGRAQAWPKIGVPPSEKAISIPMSARLSNHRIH